MRNLGTMSVKSIAGYRVQPGLNPMHRLGFPYLGMEFLDAGFIQHPSGAWCVEVKARIGLNTEPYYLIVSVEQARAADLVETA